MFWNYTLFDEYILIIGAWWIFDAHKTLIKNIGGGEHSNMKPSTWEVEIVSLFLVAGGLVRWHRGLRL